MTLIPCYKLNKKLGLSLLLNICARTEAEIQYSHKNRDKFISIIGKRQYWVNFDRMLKYRAKCDACIFQVRHGKK